MVFRKHRQGFSSSSSSETSKRTSSSSKMDDGAGIVATKSSLKQPQEAQHEDSAASSSPPPYHVEHRDDGGFIKEDKEGTSTKDLLPYVLEAIDTKEWNAVLDYLERDPSLAKRDVTMVCQGENSKCLLVHLLCTGPMDAPVAVIESLVTFHPASLLQAEKRGIRLPLHLAMLTDASDAIIHYLCRARPQALQHPDQEGNYPLHYAAMYGNEATMRLFVESSPQACQITNGRDRLPLHLLCARCDYDESPSLTGALQILLETYPKAVQVEDRFGRMPLHLAAEVRHYMQWDFMSKLVETYPAALIHKDKSKQIPLQLARKNHHHHHSHISASSSSTSKQEDLLLSALEEVTIKERKKANPYNPFPGLIISTPRKTYRRKGTPDLYNCYG